MKEYNGSATIMFIPICSECGERIPFVDYDFLHNDIYPYQCPKCERIFLTITVPTKFPFRNETSQCD